MHIYFIVGEVEYLIKPKCSIIVSGWSVCYMCVGCTELCSPSPFPIDCQVTGNIFKTFCNIGYFGYIL